MGSDIDHRLCLVDVAVQAYCEDIHNKENTGQNIEKINFKEYKASTLDLFV